MNNRNSLRVFVIFTYGLFWILFAITGFLVYLKAPDFTITVMKNVDAWTSTFVLIILFKKLYPEETFGNFLKKQFPKVAMGDFLIPMLLQVVIVICSIFLLTLIKSEKFESIKLISFVNILPLIFINITSGPMGEELGWRTFALNDLQKKYSPLIAAIIIGFLWGFWHFPLWIISGLTGYDLLFYSLSFMLGIISFSVFVTYFYNKTKNILVAVWIHFLFNFLLQIVIIEDYRLITIVSIFYLIVGIGIVLFNKKVMLEKFPVKEISQDLKNIQLENCY